MPRFSANLSFLYKEYDFFDRFQAAANDGFGSVEYLFPYEFKISELTKVLGKANIKQSLFNAPPGNWLAGERGIASLPDRSSEFKKGGRQKRNKSLKIKCVSKRKMTHRKK